MLLPVDDGGTGVDTMTGGDSNDVYYVRDVGDVVSETNAAAAGGIDRVNSSLAAYTLGANVEEGRILSGGTANLTGNGLGNLLMSGLSRFQSGLGNPFRLADSGK